jgi:hypothetical protein
MNFLERARSQSITSARAASELDGYEADKGDW